MTNVVVDQNLIRKDTEKGEFSYMYSRMPFGVGNFVSLDEAQNIFPFLRELEFRITVKGGYATLWFRPAEYAAYEQKKRETENAKDAKKAINLTPVFLIGGIVGSLVMGGLGMWFRFSGQIASGMGTKTPVDAFITYSVTTAVIVLAVWIYYLVTRNRKK